jgi:two-component system sensor histidine kinase DesK
MDLPGTTADRPDPGSTATRPGPRPTVTRSGPPATATRPDPATASPLARMRRYTTVSFSGMVGVLTAAGAVGVGSATGSAAAVVAAVLVGALVTALSLFWEHGAPRQLVIVALVLAEAFWCVSLALTPTSWGSVPVALALAVVATTPSSRAERGGRQRGWPWVAGGSLAVAVPPVAAGLTGELPVADVAPVAVSGVVFVVAAWAAYRLNRYQFGLYLEIDAARATEAELAVLRERYRFSTDLHDIQGQALHVGRLQLQLADKTLDRDVEAARGHLREAEQLIAQTIAETRRLAYGERTVTLAGEVANSAELIRAAGIELRVDGTVPAAQPLDDLLGLVVREATTNLLRHAQAEHVVIELGPGRVAVVNDGAAAPGRRLSGLARLGDRFSAVGGLLETSQHDGTFRTAARASGS